jgi:hypothetical protein
MSEITPETLRDVAEYMRGKTYTMTANNLGQAADILEQVLVARQARDRYAEILGDLMLQADAREDYPEWCKRMGHAVLDRLEADGRLAWPVVEFRPCGKGICAAEAGHEGTCLQASGWAEPEVPTWDRFEDVPQGVIVVGSDGIRYVNHGHLPLASQAQFNKVAPFTRAES